MSEEKKITVGDESVVIGNFSGNVGSKSVVVGVTENNGNTILNTSMAVGHNASAGPGSIAIGAGANAGVNINTVLKELKEYVTATGDQELINKFISFDSEATKPEKDKTVLQKLWEGIKGAAALNGASILVARITQWLTTL